MRTRRALSNGGHAVARSQEIVVTFAVKVKMPKGSNGAALQHYIREAIAGWGGGKDPDDPHFGIKEEDFTVRMVKKEVSYGG